MFSWEFLRDFSNTHFSDDFGRTLSLYRILNHKNNSLIGQSKYLLLDLQTSDLYYWRQYDVILQRPALYYFMTVLIRQFNTFKYLGTRRIHDLFQSAITEKRFACRS